MKKMLCLERCGACGKYDMGKITDLETVKRMLAAQHVTLLDDVSVESLGVVSWP